MDKNNSKENIIETSTKALEYSKQGDKAKAPNPKDILKQIKKQKKESGD